MSTTDPGPELVTPEAITDPASALNAGGWKSSPDGDFGYLVPDGDDSADVMVVVHPLDALAKILPGLAWEAFKEAASENGFPGTALLGATPDDPFAFVATKYGEGETEMLIDDLKAALEAASAA